MLPRVVGSTPQECQASLVTSSPVYKIKLSRQHADLLRRTADLHLKGLIDEMFNITTETQFSRQEEWMRIVKSIYEKSLHTEFYIGDDEAEIIFLFQKKFESPNCPAQLTRMIANLANVVAQQAIAQGCPFQ